MRLRFSVGLLAILLFVIVKESLYADGCLCTKQRNQSRSTATYSTPDRTQDLLNALRLMQAEAASRAANPGFRAAQAPNSRMARASAVLDQLHEDLNLPVNQGRSASNARFTGLEPLFLLQLAETVLPSLTQFHGNQIDEFQFAGLLTKAVSDFLQKNNVQSSSNSSASVAASIKQLQSDLNKYYADRDNVDNLLKTLTETITTQKPSTPAQPTTAQPTTGSETSIPGTPR